MLPHWNRKIITDAKLSIATLHVIRLYESSPLSTVISLSPIAGAPLVERSRVVRCTEANSDTMENHRTIRHVRFRTPVSFQGTINKVACMESKSCARFGLSRNLWFPAGAHLNRVKNDGSPPRWPTYPMRMHTYVRTNVPIVHLLVCVFTEFCRGLRLSTASYHPQPTAGQTRAES